MAASLSLLWLPLAMGCGSPTQQPPVSREGREICRERAAQASTTSTAQARFHECLRGIEAERAAARRPSPPTSAEAPPPPAIPTDPYLHCLMVQSQVIATEKRRLQVQPRWIVAAARLSPTDREYIEAKRAYDKVLADFERLIPPEVRRGAPLIPDAVRSFQRCDRSQWRTP